MNIVIDTNILISSLYKQNGVIYELLAKLFEKDSLFISDITFIELAKHQDRILKTSKIPFLEFELLKSKIFSKTEIINLSQIPDLILNNSFDLLHDIDENHFAFIATTLYVKGFLWTGDKKLYNGLKLKKFKKILNTNDIKTLINYE